MSKPLTDAEIKFGLGVMVVFLVVLALMLTRVPALATVIVYGGTIAYGYRAVVQWLRHKDDWRKEDSHD